MLEHLKDMAMRTKNAEDYSTLIQVIGFLTEVKKMSESFSIFLDKELKLRR